MNLKHLGFNLENKHVLIQKFSSNISDSIFMHQFIEDSKIVFTLYITRSLAPFYEQRNLNIDFLIPKKSKSFTRK
jgi:hypothetical protein